MHELARYPPYGGNREKVRARSAPIRFLKYSDNSVMAAIATRAGGEVVATPD